MSDVYRFSNTSTERS